MSLDIYFKSNVTVENYSTGIFIRENGSNRELTIEEARERYPDANIELQNNTTEYLFSANITHNMNKMADAVGLYEYLWDLKEKHPDMKPFELLPKLSRGLAKLDENKQDLLQFEPSNGWGSWDALVGFIAEIIQACVMYPYAEIEVSR